MNKKKQAMMVLLSVGLVLSSIGCSSDDEDEGETVGDLCRAACDASEDECSADSAGGQLAEFCSFRCLTLVDSDDCKKKYQALSDCEAMQTLDCDTASFEDPGACELEGQPFVIGGTGAGENGECIRDDVTTE